MYKQVEAGEGCGRQRLSSENTATFVKTRDLFHWLWFTQCLQPDIEKVLNDICCVVNKSNLATAIEVNLVWKPAYGSQCAVDKTIAVLHFPNVLGPWECCWNKSFNSSLGGLMISWVQSSLLTAEQNTKKEDNISARKPFTDSSMWLAFDKLHICIAPDTTSVFMWPSH